MRDAVHVVRRFFWLPRGTPRRPTSAGQALATWCLSAAGGVGCTAIGWADTAATVLVVPPLLYMLDEVAEAIRNRWPAFVLAIAAGWGVGRLVHAVLPDPLGRWEDYAVLALCTAVAVATFVLVNRLPGRRS